MAAGEWKYNGVTEVQSADPQPGDDEFTVRTALYQIEALKSLGQADIELDTFVISRRYARVRIVGEWAPDSADQFNTLSVTVDGVILPYEREDGLPVDEDDYPDDEVLDWISPDSSLLRDVPFKRLFSQAAADLRGRERGKILDGQRSLPIDYLGGKLPDFKALRAEWPKGDTRKVASWAGYLYASAVADGQPATKAVQDAFDVSRRTAQRMIGMARELDFLDADVVGAPVPSRNRKGPTDHEQGTT